MKGQNLKILFFFLKKRNFHINSRLHKENFGVISLARALKINERAVGILFSVQAHTISTSVEGGHVCIEYY